MCVGAQRMISIENHVCWRIAYDFHWESCFFFFVFFEKVKSVRLFSKDRRLIHSHFQKGKTTFFFGKNSERKL